MTVVQFKFLSYVVPFMKDFHSWDLFIALHFLVTFLMPTHRATAALPPTLLTLQSLFFPGSSLWLKAHPLVQVHCRLISRNIFSHMLLWCYDVTLTYIMYSLLYHWNLIWFFGGLCMGTCRFLSIFIFEDSVLSEHCLRISKYLAVIQLLLKSIVMIQE